MLGLKNSLVSPWAMEKKCVCEGVASQDFRARRVQLATTEFMMVFQSEESNTEIDGHRSTWTLDFRLSSVCFSTYSI